ncbi:hypothetical protein OH76DRAFT_1416385 [Lentinus brumalis]|uniref:Uncharacterized protein n=1 Tax=Lentinus brumalis TaxID=2498619 RepID=A0A371DJH5_9APHY|nr:hypothetical protein OH76DRAFT_1416385 [Polyporus brumalis]
MHFSFCSLLIFFGAFLAVAVTTCTCRALGSLDFTELDIDFTELDVGHCDRSEALCSQQDLPSLLAWHRACRRNEEIVKPLLIQTYNGILGHFVDDVEGFLEMLTYYHAVITREAALAFFLRVERAVSVAVIKKEGWGIERELEDKFNLTHLREDNTRSNSAIPMDEHEHCFFLPSGTTIILFVSVTNSLLQPVAARRALMACMNYFNAGSFGCDYPALTLRRVTFKPDIESLTACQEIDLKAHLNVLEGKYGFAAASSDISTLVPVGAATTTPQGTPLPGVLAGLTPCLRTQYLCPRQEHFFGDGGSLVDFFDMSGDTVECVQRDRCAPFGPAAVWRLTGYYEAYSQPWNGYMDSPVCNEVHQ